MSKTIGEDWALYLTQLTFTGQEDIYLHFRPSETTQVYTKGSSKSLIFCNEDFSDIWFHESWVSVEEGIPNDMTLAGSLQEFMNHTQIQYKKLTIKSRNVILVGEYHDDTAKYDLNNFVEKLLSDKSKLVISEGRPLSKHNYLMKSRGKPPKEFVRDANSPLQFVQIIGSVQGICPEHIEIIFANTLEDNILQILQKIDRHPIGTDSIEKILNQRAIKILQTKGIDKNLTKFDAGNMLVASVNEAMVNAVKKEIAQEGTRDIYIVMGYNHFEDVSRRVEAVDTGEWERGGRERERTASSSSRASRWLRLLRRGSPSK